LSIVLAVVCVLLMIAAMALIVNSGSISSAPTPIIKTKTGTPAPSPSGSGALASPSGPAGSPGSSLQTWPTASITFSNLMLDADSDSSHTLRTFTFTSDGPGPVVIRVRKSEGGELESCLSVDGSTPACKTGTKPNWLSAKATTEHSTWVLTLLGTGSSTPTVEIEFSWPSAGPSMTLTHGRFQGSPAVPALRGFTAAFKPRAGGQLTVDASWTEANTGAQLTLADVTGTTPAIIETKDYTAATAISPTYSHEAVTSVKYQVLFLNTGPDAARPDLTATITFP
jgi:hypothetical protein